MGILERAGVVPSTKGKGKDVEFATSGHIVFVEDEETGKCRLYDEK